MKEIIKDTIFESLIIFTTIAMSIAICGYELGIYLSIPFVVGAIAICNSLRSPK